MIPLPPFLLPHKSLSPSFLGRNRMEDLYSIHPGISRMEDYTSIRSTSSCEDGITIHDSPPDLPDYLIKAQIASHPRYPSLLSAYIDCRKVGAPPEIAALLEEIGQEKYQVAPGELGADPELDEFMESYCRALVRYKEELSKPLDEAASFLTSVEAQLRSLCSIDCPATSAASAARGGANASFISDEAAGSSEEELSYGDFDALEVQECGSPLGDHELKGMLLKKYSGYLSNLRKEFMKKRKKGKLPKDARVALLDWWNSHSRWPYPTEEEKAKLAEMTGLDQKQINNWFINQRKRHWKPSEDMQFALMQGVRGETSSTMLYFDTGTIGP